MDASAAALPREPDRIDLYWIPLGAGPGAGPGVVRVSGRVYRVLASVRGGHTGPVFHAALVLWSDGRARCVEMAPAWGAGAGREGVVGTGPVGLRALGRWPAFRYEIRCPAGLAIPDLAHAVASPVVVGSGSAVVRRVLDLVEWAPRPTWGRDELGAGQMWNSNSLVAWLLARAGVEAGGLRPPLAGSAPGWDAGLRVARRSGRDGGPTWI